MAQNRPDKPEITLPDDFGGTQTPFSDSLVESGYEPSIPQVLEGGNLNWMLNGFFQNTKYMREVLDYVRDTPVGKMFWVNQNGQMDYIQPAVIATDVEYSAGTSTDKTPTVKQVADSFATKVNTTAMQNYVTTAINTLLSSLYPVGSIYVGTQSTCPLASLISGSTWTKVSGNRVLQTSSSSHSANTTIAAGLPNITGNIGRVRSAEPATSAASHTTGAFENSTQGENLISNYSSGSTDNAPRYKFDASLSNSIYGNSTTVQPPAYVVNVWRRTA